MWNYLWSECLRVVFFGVNIVWFGSWCRNWFCQKNQSNATLWVFWTRVSSLDFCLWWSFWSLLHYPRTYTTELHIQKNFRLWQRDPHSTVHQSLGYIFFEKLGDRKFASGFSALLVGWMCLCSSHECNTSITRSHESREQKVRPFSNQHPTKELQIL